MPLALTCPQGHRTELKTGIIVGEFHCPECGQVVSLSTLVMTGEPAPATPAPPSRRGLWDIMQKAPPQEPAAAITGNPPPAPAPVEPSPSDPPSTKPRGLFGLMNRAADAPPPSSPAPVREKPIESVPPPAKPVPVEPISIEPVELAALAKPSPASAAPSPAPPVAPPESVPAAPSVAVETADAAPVPVTIRPPPPTARAAGWALQLGLASIPLSLLSLLPGVLGGIPAMVAGIAALLFGFNATNEIQRSRGRLRGTKAAYVGITLGTVGMFLGPLIIARIPQLLNSAGEQTQAHLRQVGLALGEYHAAHQVFPPGGVFLRGAEGEVVYRHGWMTMLLPHLGEMEISRQIKWDQPFDSLENRPAMAQGVPAFLAEGGPNRKVDGLYGITHFAGVGGEVRLSDGTYTPCGIFGVNSAVTLDDISDGAANTLIAGEIATMYPAWGDPQNWREVSRGINRDPEGFGSVRLQGTCFLLGDGSVRVISDQTDPDILRRLSTRDGGETP